MMADQVVILCGSAELTSHDASLRGARSVRVKLTGSGRSATLRISDITDKMVAALPPVVADLLEIAAYVYCADQAVGRGGPIELKYGTKWHRRFRFEVPVRCPDVWSDPELSAQLESTLGFLSDDNFEFHFSKLTDPPPLVEYLEFDQHAPTPPSLDGVLLFSGGLDSFAGAVQEILTQGRQVALVSHRSVAKVDSRQKRLVESLTERADRRKAPFHIPIWVHQHDVRARDFTQRSRSFLFAALAVAVAKIYELDRIQFYENGIVSFNLPICAQLVGARATRTTHPRVLNDLSRLFSMLLGEDFHVENPFLWHTKTDVAAAVKDAGHGDLARYTVSCTRTMAATKLHTHCGLCSQCVDRRFATLSADYKDDDPAEMYKVDLLTGPRETTVDRTMVERWVSVATEVEGMDDPVQFLQRFPEVNSALSQLEERADHAAVKVFDLHKRHAAQVTRVLDAAIEQHASDLRRGDLHDSCLLAMVCAGGPRSTAALEIKTVDPPEERAMHAEQKHWLTVTEAHKVSDLPTYEITRLANNGILLTNGETHRARRIDPLSLAQVKLKIDKDDTLKRLRKYVR